MQKPILADQLVQENENQSEYNGKWYVAKAIRYDTIITKLYWCYLIFIGKARAYQYMEDRE